MIALNFSTSSITYCVTQSSQPRPQSLAALTSEVSRGKRFQGKVSNRLASQIKKKVSAWCFYNEEAKKHGKPTKYASGRDFKFVTLTLPGDQIHSHKTIKRECLNFFLINLARKFPSLKYFWKAELHKSQKIHFHLIVDSFISHTLLRKLWNQSIERLGYVTRYQKKSISTYKNRFEVYQQYFPKKDLAQTLKAFQYGVSTNWSDPNSTDIHNLEKVKSVPAYIAKYVSKGSGIEEQNFLEDYFKNESFGRIWGCCDSLREQPPLKISVDIEEFREIIKYVAPSIFKSHETEEYTTLIFQFSDFSRIRLALIQNFTFINPLEKCLKKPPPSKPCISIRNLKR
jgi:hypothetical protein